jgi:hypothetical protein
MQSVLRVSPCGVAPSSAMRWSGQARREKQKQLDSLCRCCCGQGPLARRCGFDQVDSLRPEGAALRCCDGAGGAGRGRCAVGRVVQIAPVGGGTAWDLGLSLGRMDYLFLPIFALHLLGHAHRRENRRGIYLNLALGTSRKPVIAKLHEQHCQYLLPRPMSLAQVCSGGRVTLQDGPELSWQPKILGLPPFRVSSA